MRTILTKIAALLAFVIGAMAIFAGGPVLLGNLPDYPVINWLPVYNFVLGVVSALFTTLIIWKNTRYALLAAMTTLSLHAAVMITLLTAYRTTVASESLLAMTIRILVWTLIVGLMLAQRRRDPAPRIDSIRPAA